MKKSLSLFCAGTCLFSLMFSTVLGADGVWTAGTGEWTNTSLWAEGIVPGNGDAAYFSGSGGTVTVPTGEAFTLSRLFFNTNNLDKTWVITGETNTLVAPAEIVVSNGIATFNCSLTGTNGFSKTGMGRIDLFAQNSLTGSYIFSGGRTLIDRDESLGPVPSSLQSDAVIINGSGFGNNWNNLVLAPTRGVTVESDGAYFFGRGDGTTEISSPITGSGIVNILRQTGPVKFSSAQNNYTNDTIIGFNNSVYGSFSAADSATLIAGTDDILPHGSGKGNLYIIGSNKGLLELNGKTVTVNSLFVSDGGIISNSAPSDAVLHVGDDNRNSSFSGILKEGVILDKIGSGILVCNSAGTSTGRFLVSEGSLEISNELALVEVPVVLDGGTLKTSVQVADQEISANLMLAQNGTMDRTNATQAFAWAGSLSATNESINPILTVSGGTGPFIVGATDIPGVYNLDVNASEGVLFQNKVWLKQLPVSSDWTIADGSDVTIGTPGLLGSGSITLTNHSLRIVSGDALVSETGLVTVDGTGNTVWFDTLKEQENIITADSAYSLAVSNEVILAGTSAQVGFDGLGTVTFLGSITGSGTLLKNGSGDAILGGSNDMTGSVVIQEGRLFVNNDSLLGDSGNSIVIDGGELAIPDSTTFSSARNIESNSGKLNAGSGTSIILSGSLTGSIEKDGTGNLEISGSSTNTDFTLNVTEGSVSLNKTGAAAVTDISTIAPGSIVTLNGTGGDQISGDLTLSGGVFDLNGHSETVGSLSSMVISSVITNGGGSAAVLTVGEGDADGTFFGSLADGAELGLTKIGSGTQTIAGLSGSQSASGNIGIEGGTLAFGAEVHYVRITPTLTRTAGNAPGIGEFQLLLNEEPVNWPEGTTTTASSTSAPGHESWYLIDTDSHTYWRSGTSSGYVTVNLGGPVLCNGYRWHTNNDSSSIDPLSWTVEVSEDGQTWLTVDTRSNEDITTTRGVLAGEYTFTGDFANDAVSPDADAIVSDGTTLKLNLESESVASLSGAGNVVFDNNASLHVSDASTFSGTLTGEGRLLVENDVSLDIPVLASQVTVVNEGAAPAAVTIGDADDSFFTGALADGTSSMSLIKSGSGTIFLKDAGSTYSGDTIVEEGTLCVQPPEWKFRYIRFHALEIVGGASNYFGYYLCLAEFQLMRYGQPVAYPAGTTATTPYANHTSGPAANAVNGLTTDRWLSTVLDNPLTIDMQEPVSFDGYHWYTSGVNGTDYNRAPTAWTVEGSVDGVNWTTIDSRSGVSIPSYTAGVGKEVGPYALRSERYSLPEEFFALTDAGAVKVAAVSSRYLRFTVTDARWESGDFGNTGFQLSELQLQLNGNPVNYPAGTTATAPGDGYSYAGTYYKPEMAVDNILPVGTSSTNRWYSTKMINPLTVDMGEQVVFNGYSWYTGPNAIGRDPLGWQLEISNDSNTWYTVDTQFNQSITTTRNTLAGTWAFDIPAGLSAADTIPDNSRTMIALSATLQIDALSETVGPLSGTGTVALASSTLGINAFEDALYAGDFSGAGSILKTGAATQTLSGSLAYNGDIIVEEGCLNLDGAVLDGVTNIILTGEGSLTGTADVAGDLTLTFDNGGLYGADLTVNGALSVSGDVTLILPEDATLPYSQQIATFASIDAASSETLSQAVVNRTIPSGYRTSVRITGTEAFFNVSLPGTVLLIR